MTAPTILQALRQGTADLHESLETALPLGGDLSLDQYRAVLTGFYGYWSAWEERARSLAPAPFAGLLAERARAALLASDLRALGTPAVGPASSIAPYVPALDTTAGLLGSMYVLEGSRLGGQVLVRNLAVRLALTPEHGLSFFYGFGPETGAHWKAFCRLIEQELSTAHVDPAVDAARQTFLGLEDWLRTSGILHSFCIPAVDTNS